jgi:hypothetical protein
MCGLGVPRYTDLTREHGSRGAYPIFMRRGWAKAHDNKWKFNQGLLSGRGFRRCPESFGEDLDQTGWEKRKRRPNEETSLPKEEREPCLFSNMSALRAPKSLRCSLNDQRSGSRRSVRGAVRRTRSGCGPLSLGGSARDPGVAPRPKGLGEGREAGPVARGEGPLTNETDATLIGRQRRATCRRP